MHKKLIRLLMVILTSLVLIGYAPEAKPTKAQTSRAVMVGAGDIAKCSGSKDAATAKLLDSLGGTVFTLGDNVYPDGSLSQFRECYSLTWGREKGRTRPAVGNHEYHINGAAGYFTYFGKAASTLQDGCTRNCKGYYSYKLGSWHIIVLNSEIPHGKNSAQLDWLRSDLEAHNNVCTLAYWHRPLFSSGPHGNSDSMLPVWRVLFDYHADVVLNGHDHLYERFARQTPTGKAAARGIRQFTVGTGGASLYPIEKIQPNSEVRNARTWGVLRLVLMEGAYSWRFLPIEGQTFTDSGRSPCSR